MAIINRPKLKRHKLHNAVLIKTVHLNRKIDHEKLKKCCAKHAQNTYLVNCNIALSKLLNYLALLKISKNFCSPQSFQIECNIRLQNWIVQSYNFCCTLSSLTTARKYEGSFLQADQSVNFDSECNLPPKSLPIHIQQPCALNQTRS